MHKLIGSWTHLVAVCEGVDDSVMWTWRVPDGVHLLLLPLLSEEHLAMFPKSSQLDRQTIYTRQSYLSFYLHCLSIKCIVCMVGALPIPTPRATFFSRPRIQRKSGGRRSGLLGKIVELWMLV